MTLIHSTYLRKGYHQLDRQLYISKKERKGFNPPFDYSPNWLLNVQVLDAGGVRLYEVLARQYLVAHQHAEDAVRLGGVLHIHL